MNSFTSRHPQRAAVPSDAVGEAAQVWVRHVETAFVLRSGA